MKADDFDAVVGIDEKVLATPRPEYYEIKFEKKDEVKIVMTLTAPGCPVADQILQEVHDKVLAIPEITKVDVELTFEPTWTPDNMSEEAKLELGFL